MSLHIDHLTLQLPPSLGQRRHGILRQLRMELARRDWPAGNWQGLSPPPLQVSAGVSNAGLARQIANGLYRVAESRARNHPSAGATSC